MIDKYTIMKLRLLSEGFDLNNSSDYGLRSLVYELRLSLYDVVSNPSGSRISAIRTFLKSAGDTIDEVRIDSAEEQEYIDKIYSTIVELQDSLEGLQDGPPPDAIVPYINILSDLILSFCRNFTWRGDRGT